MVTNKIGHNIINTLEKYWLLILIAIFLIYSITGIGRSGAFNTEQDCKNWRNLMLADTTRCVCVEYCKEVEGVWYSSTSMDNPECGNLLYSCNSACNCDTSQWCHDTDTDIYPSINFNVKGTTTSSSGLGDGVDTCSVNGDYIIEHYC